MIIFHPMGIMQQKNSAPRVSFEFFPPKTEKMAETLWGSLQALSVLKPHFVSVTYGAGGATRSRTHDIVTRIQKDMGIPAAAHLTCVGATRDEIDDIARSYWEGGIRHIVALRGDLPNMQGPYTPMPEGYAYARDLVKGLKAIAPFEISVAGYPEKHPQAASVTVDIEHLKEKVEEGADRILCQFTFNPDVFLFFRDRVRDAGITVPLIPGILPIMNFQNMAKFAEKCQAHVPDSLRQRFDGLEADSAEHAQAALEIAVEHCQRLYDNGVRNFHFYTMNRSELILDLCREMGLDKTP